MTGLTAALAAFIHDKTLKDVPSEALDKAKQAIADTFAAILAGAGSEVAPPLLHYVEQTGESGVSPILGSGRMTSPELAALVNGTFGHALDFDDVLSMMPAHPSAVILPAIIADRQAGKLPGSALLEAYIIGVEVGGGARRAREPLGDHRPRPRLETLSLLLCLASRHGRCAPAQATSRADRGESRAS